MESWSTDTLAKHERFAVWREWRASHIFGVTAEVDSEERQAFRASIASRAFGDAVLVELRSSSYRARRSWQDIARVRSDSLCVYQQVAGPRWAVEDWRGGSFVVPRQHIAFGYSDLPYATLPVSSEPFHTRLVKIPMTLAHDPHGRRSDLAPRMLRSEPGPGALFAAYAESFFANMLHLQGEAAQTAIDTLGRLAILAYDKALPIEAVEGGPLAVAAGRLHLVQVHLRANLHRSDLSPETVAREMRMSVRQLHRLFEPTGTTFARYVTTQRIERVAEILAGAPAGSIIDTAFACGFSGTSAFYRAFRTHFGMSPSDYRQPMPRRSA